MPSQKVKGMSTLSLKPGSVVLYNGERYSLIQIKDLESVVLKSEKSQEIEIAPVSKLLPTDYTAPPVLTPSEILPEAVWSSTQKKFKIIEPLLELPNRTEKDVQLRASEHGLSFTTLYRWIREYEKSGTIYSLATNKRADAGVGRLSPQLEDIITKHTQKNFLTRQRIRVSGIFERICDECNEKGLQPPSRATIYRRLNQLPVKDKVRSRLGSSAAQPYERIRGQFPHANSPLAVVQVDHTQMDIIVVDEETGTALGRPWLTMGIDVYSRMVVGIHISLDAPGTIGTGMCLAQAILNKSKILAELETTAKWPCQGFMQTIHLDNGKEFHSKALKRACDIYGIRLEWRPPGTPRFGGHIERLLGTVAKKIHELPGTTFSNVKQREGYDSESKAVFTLPALEKWLYTYIVGDYHQSYHSGIKMAPIQKYQEGILGDGDKLGRGLPKLAIDEERLRLDFAPGCSRTIQPCGVSIHGIKYNDHSLSRWIHAKDPVNSKLKRKFLFKYDPRDISMIWFWDPELEQYFSIPYSHISYPAISLWEYRAIAQKLKNESKIKANEQIIFETHKELREIEARAVKHTKAARRHEARRKGKKTLPSILAPEERQKEKEVEISAKTLSVKKIKHFEGMEEWGPDE